MPAKLVPAKDGETSPLLSMPFRVESFGPMVLVRRPMRDELKGYETLDELFAILLRPERFAFEHFVARMLLFSHALWPDDQDRKMTMARLACALVHTYAASPRETLRKYHIKISRRQIRSLDEAFFARLGGMKSVVFHETSIADFLTQINRRLDSILPLERSSTTSRR